MGSLRRSVGGQPHAEGIAEKQYQHKPFVSLFVDVSCIITGYSCVTQPCFSLPLVSVLINQIHIHRYTYWHRSCYVRVKKEGEYSRVFTRVMITIEVFHQAQFQHY
jgi:hypothetical protein